MISSVCVRKGCTLKKVIWFLFLEVLRFVFAPLYLSAVLFAGLYFLSLPVVLFDTVLLIYLLLFLAKWWGLAGAIGWIMIWAIARIIEFKEDRMIKRRIAQEKK